jgi:transcriptional regulator with XRE-family HTH domain
MPTTKRDDSALATSVITEVLATEIARLGLERGLSVEDLSIRSGIAKKVILQTLERRQNVTIETIHALAVALDVPAQELLRIGMPLEPFDLTSIAGRSGRAPGKKFASTLRSIVK